MKNVDVPLWDKGDNTDDFKKSRASSRSFGPRPDLMEKTKKVEKIYKRILGRKPTTRELSYYRYSPVDSEEISKELLSSEEFKENVKKIEEYPDLKDSLKRSEVTILKLKTQIEDQEKEYMELKTLLDEKNRLIKEIREVKTPYLTTEVENIEGIQYQNLSRETKEETSVTKKEIPLFKEDSLIYRIIDLFRK